MENLVGYVHSVSPTKRSKRKSLPYFDFKLQTETGGYNRVVCFNEKLRSSLDKYQQANVPVKIRNASRSKSLRDDNETNFLLNKRSRIEEANNNEVQFEALPLPEPTIRQVQLQEINSIDAETKVNVKALLTKNNELVRLVRNVGGQDLQMNDACFLTDDTGPVKLTLWGEAIHQLQSGQAYDFTQLRVKEFQDMKYLTTTPTSTFTQTDEEFLPPDEDVVNDIGQETIAMPHIDMYVCMYVCKKCEGHLTDVTSLATAKCSTCNSIMLVQRCSKKATIRIGLQRPDQQVIWLTLFHQELQDLLSRYNNEHNTEISINSPEDVLCHALLLSGNLELTYETSTNIVRSLVF